ncbi:zinc ribbon domain-containing protein [Chloroflexota bacterium]
MPIYEYRCKSCGRRLSIFVQGMSTTPSQNCNACGGTDLVRLFSTFAIGKTDRGIYEDILNDNNLVRGLEQNDPRALVEWNKRMSRGLDEQSGPEHEELLGRMEAGEPVHEVMRKIKADEETSSLGQGES